MDDNMELALEDERGVEEFKPVKGGLRLTEDDEEDVSDDKSLNISYLEDDSPSVEEVSVHSLSLRDRGEGREARRVQKTCKSELE